MLFFFPTQHLFPDLFVIVVGFCSCYLFFACFSMYLLIPPQSPWQISYSALDIHIYQVLLSAFSFWRNHMRNLLTNSSKQDWLSLRSMCISYPGSQPLVGWLSASHSFLCIGLLFHFRGAHLSVGRSLFMRKNAWEVNFWNLLSWKHLYFTHTWLKEVHAWVSSSFWCWC